MNSTAREDILKESATELFSILSLLFRWVDSDLIKMTLASTDGQIIPLNYESKAIRT